MGHGGGGRSRDRRGGTQRMMEEQNVTREAMEELREGQLNVASLEEAGTSG